MTADERLARLDDIISRIKALTENPHWTTDRRWRIAELATQAQAIVAQLKHTD